MGLRQNTDIQEPFPHQNPALSEAATQHAGFDAITATNVTQQFNLNTYQTRVTTGSSGAVAQLPAGLFPGQRKVITLAALGQAGQTLVVTPAAGVAWKQVNGTTDVTSITFNAANQFLLVEWNGQRWTNINATATVA